MKMKITLRSGFVEIDRGESAHTMTLEQYAKHAQDPAFVAAADPQEHRRVMQAHAEASGGGDLVKE